MKKIITAAFLAAAVTAGAVSAFAADCIITRPLDTRAVLVCYGNDGRLVYSNMFKAADSHDFSIHIPHAYEDTDKKVYFVDTGELAAFDALEFAPPVPENTPEASAEPSASASPEPAASANPTISPKAAASAAKSNSPYEKAADGVYAPAFVTEVASGTNANDEGVYIVTLYYRGEEITAEIEDGLTISTAPDEYSYMAGQTAGALEKGDVICITANIAGDRIKGMDFITRPPAEDIVTSGADFGADFERLFAADGKVAGKWAYRRYGSKPPKDKYQYAYGIVAKMSGQTLTLLNTGGVTDDALDIDVDPNAYVYVCDVSGKEYSAEIGGRGDIGSTLPSRLIGGDIAELDDGYSYNYALVRLVDDTATDIVVFENYND